MENKYWIDAMVFKMKVLEYVKQILKVCGNELLLRIEDLNLLSCENNCIESSTAIGYCMEEFIVSKLLTYTKNHANEKGEYVISRDNVNTQNSSFDCYCKNNGVQYLINLKANKSNNNAVAAIKQIYVDYVLNQPNQVKHFMILKLNYSIGSGKGEQRKILIKEVEAYFLEEINFALGHKQDHRNWSEVFDANSGRMQITPRVLKENRIEDSKISYEATRQFINDIFFTNKNKKKK